MSQSNLQLLLGRGLLITSLALLAGCGAAPGAQPTSAGESAAASPATPATPPRPAGPCPSASGPIAGPVIYGSGQNLWAMQPDGSGVQQVTNLGARASARDPAWSPDRSTLAFSLVLLSDDPATLWLQKGLICGLDRATGAGRLLVQSADSTDLLAEPSWTPDGAALSLTRKRTLLDAKQQFQGEQVNLVRYTLTASTEQVLLKDGINSTLSPDGTQLVYIFVNPETYLLSLMIANSDGSNPQPLIKGNQGFLVVDRPRWAPDGKSIGFAAIQSVGGSPAPADSRSWLDRLLGIQVASAHGEPMTIWRVDPDGQNLTSLAAGIDDPRISWNPAGTGIIFTTGLDGVKYLDLTSGTISNLTEPGEYWAVAWAAH